MARHKSTSLSHEELKQVSKSCLNSNLIKKQDLNEDQIDKIADLHAFLEETMNKMDALKDGDVIELRELRDEVERLEFALQDAWGFPQDKNFHSWWYRVPHCRCPKLDNQDWYGTKFRITVANCPIHGG